MVPVVVDGRCAGRKDGDKVKTKHWNGEHWYERDWSVIKHVRRWFVWIGGIEKPNGGGWRLPRVHNAHGKRWRFHPRNVFDALTPMSFFGHRITCYGWGWSFNPRNGRRILTISRSGVPRDGQTKIYLSRDGTPSNATTWLRGWSDWELRDYAERQHAATVDGGDDAPDGRTETR